MKNISYLEFFIRNINIIKYLFFLYDRKKFNPFYSKNFKEFIINNKKKWGKLNLNKSKIDEYILVESFINQPAYTLSNGIISVFLKKIFQGHLIGIIKKGDIKSEIIYRSYGVNNFIYYKNLNFFNKIIYNYKSLKLLKERKKIGDFINLKYLNIDVGLTAYDSYIRYVGNPTLKEVNCELIIFLAQALYACDFFSKIINKNNKIKKLVQSEASFIPLNLLFQVCLKNKLEVFSRVGKEDFALRKFTNFKQRYEKRHCISQNLFDEIYKNHKAKALNKIKKIQNKKLKMGTFGLDISMYYAKKLPKGKTTLQILNQDKNSDQTQKKLFYDKKNFRKLFNWDNKKIVVFFQSYLTDNNFPLGPRINFQDSYSWTDFVLKQIPKLKNVNWVIKDHPNKKMGTKSKKDFKKIISNLERKYDHIRSWPKHIDNKSLINITDVAITSSGTVGIEYPAYGVNSLFTEKSPYSHLNFMKMVKSKKKILQTLKKIHKISGPTKLFSEKCKIYAFIREIILRQRCTLLPNYVSSRNIDEAEFWKLCTKAIYKFQFSKDIFFKMLKKQLKFNSRHTVNYNIINFKNKIFNDFTD